MPCSPAVTPPAPAGPASWVRKVEPGASRGPPGPGLFSRASIIIACHVVPGLGPLGAPVPNSRSRAKGLGVWGPCQGRGPAAGGAMGCHCCAHTPCARKAGLGPLGGPQKAPRLPGVASPSRALSAGCSAPCGRDVRRVCQCVCEADGAGPVCVSLRPLRQAAASPRGRRAGREGAPGGAGSTEEGREGERAKDRA